jgi:hypothetical protein
VQAHIRGQFNALFFFEIQSMCNLKKFETWFFFDFFRCSIWTTYHLHHSDKRLKKWLKLPSICFLVRLDYSIFKIIQKIYRIWKTYNMQNLQNFIIYPTVYYLHHLEKALENRSKSSFSGNIGTFCILKIKFKHTKSVKSVNIKKLLFFIPYSTVYHLHNSDKRLIF